MSQNTMSTPMADLGAGSISQRTFKVITVAEPSTAYSANLVNRHFAPKGSMGFGRAI